MADKKRNIKGYEELYAVRLGGGEVIVAENKTVEARYMVCDSSRDNPLGIEMFQNGVGSADFVEIMKAFTDRLAERVTALETGREKRGIPLQTLTAADCYPAGDTDLNGCVVVIKPEILAPEYRSIDHQLAICTGGFGASPSSRGRTVFCTNLYTGESSGWTRQDIAGTVSEERLPDWAKEKLAVLQAARRKTVAQTAKPLDKEKFWQIIDEAWKASGEIWQDMNIPLTEALSRVEEPDIIRFKLIFDEYKNLAYREKLWAAAAIMHNGCSDDGFIDFRAWLIAQGKEAYMNVLGDPDSLADLTAVKDFAIEIKLCKNMPQDGYFHSADFEGFNYVANNAYKINMGADSDIYDVLEGNALSKQEKADIAGEIIYAADIDAKWGGLGTSWEETETALGKLLPKLHKVFHEKESVIEKIRQSKQKAEPEKHKNKHSKGGPEL